MKTAKFLQFLLAFCLLLPVLACEKDDPKTENKTPSQIVGKWEHFYSNEHLVFMIKLEFYDNGTYSGDSYEVQYGDWNYDNPNLTLEQATVTIRNKPWGTSVADFGKWSTTDNSLLSVGGFFEDTILKYTLVNNILVITWDDEDYMFSKI